MSPLLRRSVFVLALGAVGVVASAHSASADNRFPENSTSYRKRMDNVTKAMRSSCARICPALDRDRIMAAISKVESRVMDVCADGWVTSAENDYVMSVMPAAAPPRPRPN